MLWLISIRIKEKRNWKSLLSMADCLHAQCARTHFSWRARIPITASRHCTQRFVSVRKWRIFKHQTIELKWGKQQQLQLPKRREKIELNQFDEWGATLWESYFSEVEFSILTSLIFPPSCSSELSLGLESLRNGEWKISLNFDYENI